MLRRIVAGIVPVLLAVSGCVLVNPGEVRLGSPAPAVVVSPTPSGSMTPYGHALHRVIQKQDEVLTDVRKHKWSHVAEGASEWMGHVRTLSGYANTTHAPARFRQYCDQLLVQVQAVRDAALCKDRARCEAAFRACDPTLNGLSRDFPMVAASRPPVQQAPAGRAP